MAKRFTDTEKWKKPFIRGLQAPYKLLFLYILDECNHAGIWQVEIDIASLRIGELLDVDLAKKQLKNKIIEIRSGEKWFIPDFIEFQYGILNPENRAHNSVILILDKYKLLDKNKHLKSPLQGRKDMDKEKDKEKDKDKEVNYPWEELEFAQIWEFWKKYKSQQHNFNYKEIGEQGALSKLFELSDGKLEAAMLIVKQSIQNGWKGFFALKGESKNEEYDREQIFEDLRKGADS